MHILFKKFRYPSLCRDEYFSSDRQEQSDGKNTLLVFNDGLQHILKESIQNRGFDSETILMVKQVKLIRKEVYEWNSFFYFGSFPFNSQENSVSPTLKMSISMFLNGPIVRNQCSAESQSRLTIDQLKHFNMKHKAYNTENQRH